MLFSIPQNGELTLRKFGDSNLLITIAFRRQHLGSYSTATTSRQQRCGKYAPVATLQQTRNSNFNKNNS